MLLLSFAAFSVSTDIAVAPSVHAQSVEDIEPVATAGTSTVTVIQPKKVVVEDALACNCYAFLATLIPGLPHMNQIMPNSQPKEGGSVVMNYDGTPHVAFIVSVFENGVLVHESNYHHCKYDYRLVKFSDPALQGFWSPEPSLNG